jgi:peptide/nickel transport system permease protein
MAGLAQVSPAPSAAAAAGRPGLAGRLWRQPSGRTGLIILAVMVLAGLASLAGLAPDAPDVQNPAATLHGPSAAHLFGTDQLGRDVLSRVMSGTVLSLQTALLAVATARWWARWAGWPRGTSAARCRGPSPAWPT